MKNPGRIRLAIKWGFHKIDEIDNIGMRSLLHQNKKSQQQNVIYSKQEVVAEENTPHAHVLLPQSLVSPPCKQQKKL